MKHQIRNSLFSLVIGLSLFVHAKADYFAYVPEFVSGDYVHVVNTNHNVLVTSISVFGSPEHVLVTRSGRFVYVNSRLQVEGEEDSVYLNVIDALSNTQTGLISLPGNFVGSMALSADDQTLYVTQSDGLSIIQNPYISNGAIKSEYSLTYTGLNAELTADGKYLFVLGTDSNSVYGISVFEIATNTEVASYELGADLGSIALLYNDDEKLLYVANRAVDQLVSLKVSNYLEPASFSLVVDTIRQFSEGSSPTDIAFYSAKNELLVPINGSKDEKDTLGRDGYIAVLNPLNISEDASNGITRINLSDEETTFAQFSPIHPFSISIDDVGRIHTLKKIWSDKNGLYLNTLSDFTSSRNGSRSITEKSSINLAPQGDTRATGRFIGPDCEECPKGDINNDDGFTRPSALNPLILVLFGIILIFSRKINIMRK